MIVFLCLLAGCLQDPSSSTYSFDTSNPFNSGFTDTAYEPILAEVGSWTVSNPELISDVCNVADFQEVNEMVPAKFMIEESYLTLFKTDSTSCSINPTGGFICDVTSLQEPALGGTATLQIETMMKGKIITPSEMNLAFDVVIKACEGIGCAAIELALTFPCPIILNSTGSL